MKLHINTLYNVCAVPWREGVQYRGVGVFSTVGDIMMHVREYLEYRGRCSVSWGDIMINVGNILSTVGGVQCRRGMPSFSKFEYRGRCHDTCGGYHEYRGVLK